MSEPPQLSTGYVGQELMDRWNWFENGNSRSPVRFHAVMGHLTPDGYKFIIERHGKTFEISVRDVTPG